MPAGTGAAAALETANADTASRCCGVDVVDAARGWGADSDVDAAQGWAADAEAVWG